MAKSGPFRRLLTGELRDPAFDKEYEAEIERLRKERKMGPFELPNLETIRAVTTLNGYQLHEVLPGSFRIDDEMRVEWRDKNQPTDLYVTTMDRIAYVVAKTLVTEGIKEPLAETPPCKIGSVVTFEATIYSMTDPKFCASGVGGRAGILLRHWVGNSHESAIWVDTQDLGLFNIGQRVRVTVEAVEE